MTRINILMFLCFTALLSFSPSENPAALDYIERYRDLAIVEMHRTGVPASITLAQGLHETNYGQSALANRANNHFGIKCKQDWYGETYMHIDDDRNKKGKLIQSCFRAYPSSVESYVDHSNFLKSRNHYKELFTYATTDYKAWAHGLKKCGYATDKRYAYKLIDKIERYQLNQYDTWKTK